MPLPAALAAAARRALARGALLSAPRRALAAAAADAAALAAGLATLRRDGFAVVDGALGAAAADALRAEVLALRPLMHLNHTHLVGAAGAAALLAKHGILEADFTTSPAAAAAAPAAAALGAPGGALAAALTAALPRLRLAGGGAAKAQLSAGGAFPFHTDTDAAVDRRRATAIYYLNPDWEPAHGGELQLLPFPAARVPLDIAPLHGRLVVFDSRHTLHRVLPSRAPTRACVTFWFSEAPFADGGAAAAAARDAERAGARAALAAAAAAGPGDAAAAWRALASPALRGHAGKYALRDEWEASVVESHPPSPARDAAVAALRREAAVVARALAPALPALERWTAGDGGEAAAALRAAGLEGEGLWFEGL
jgi:SM-20-related protein